MADNRPIDLSVPSAARMYDWLLGGHFNYEADRLACEELLRYAPTTKALARNNRWFLERVVRALAEEHGIKQFVDFGSGLPTQNNVHQVAQAVHRDARVVYVDNDPVVLAHGRSILDSHDGNATIIEGDMTHPEAVFESAEFGRLIDLKERTAALFISVLHCVKDRDDPAGIVRRVVSRLKPGSFVVICHLVSDDVGLRDQVTDLMRKQTDDHWGRVREKWEVDRFFENLTLHRPGLVDVTDWRPDSDLRQHDRSVEWMDYGGMAEVPPRSARTDP
ncbi:SAM-dependent methyltransferase [Streptomyces sp. LP11]|uniref:SAM-dependent methyltransferase n=1 Tax=Streptomyces pyxinicus TaxID=2970331 RepID=A0ABT2B8W5_9ACTN|nr:SAM-dependent methyltransferase [Streptomyces sp. LP11]MCS0604958.1 SAM-dependent methyltransferase [Streptomyces sp. LP11]